MAYVIWLTGISGAGKTTLGLKLKAELEKKYKQVELIDGESVRKFFENDLGYTRQERILNVKRITFAAMSVAKYGTHVVVTNIAPYYEVRDFIRKNIKNYVQIYLKITVEEAIKRDTKGHYQNYKEGKLNNLIGIDDSYDVPRNPDLIVETSKETPIQSLNKIMDLLATKGI